MSGDRNQDNMNDELKTSGFLQAYDGFRAQNHQVQPPHMVLSSCLHLASELSRGEGGNRGMEKNGILFQLLHPHFPPSVLFIRSLSISRSHNLRNDNFIRFLFGDHLNLHES